MLFHFSEESDIDIFVPRKKQNRADFPAAVWAIDKEHEFTYYFPRDCPKTEDKPKWVCETALCRL